MFYRLRTYRIILHVEPAKWRYCVGNPITMKGHVMKSEKIADKVFGEEYYGVWGVLERLSVLMNHDPYFMSYPAQYLYDLGAQMRMYSKDCDPKFVQGIRLVLESYKSKEPLAGWLGDKIDLTPPSFEARALDIKEQMFDLSCELQGMADEVTDLSHLTDKKYREFMRPVAKSV